MRLWSFVRTAGAAGLLLCFAAACGEDEFAFLNKQGENASEEREYDRRSEREDLERRDDFSATPPRRTAPVEAEAVSDPTLDRPDAALDQAALRDLESVPDPANTLAAVDVRDRSGAVIGVVSAVQTHPNGTVEEIVVALDEGKTLRVTPPFAQFDDATQSVMLAVATEDLSR